MSNYSPCRIPVPAENRRAQLSVGWRKFRAEVFELSRDSFSIRVPRRVARKLSVGSRGRLVYQDSTWTIRCTNKWVNPSGQAELELQQEADLTKIKAARASFWFFTRSQRLRPDDGILPAAVFAAMLVLVFVVPSLGGQWNSPVKMNSVVSDTWNAVGNLVSSYAAPQTRSNEKN